MEIDSFRLAVAACSATAREWFLAHSHQKDKAAWNSYGGLGDNGSGAVYAFFSSSSECLYIGQTTYPLKTRARFETSCHYDTPWWEDWTDLRFMNIENQTDQLVLEVLLILTFSPRYNAKPCARVIQDMYVV